MNTATDDQVANEFFTALPDGEHQAVTAARLGYDQSVVSRVLARWREGQSVRLSARMRQAMIRETKTLVADSPAARARRDAYMRAADEAQALADRLRALASRRRVEGWSDVVGDGLADLPPGGAPGSTDGGGDSSEAGGS